MPPDLVRLAATLRERRARGEAVDPAEYREQAGASFADFVRMVTGPATPSGGLPRAEFGPYRVVRELGRGAMGVVYEAVQVALGRTVALKVMLPEAEATPEFLDRFRQEAVAAAQVAHDHVVPVYDAGEIEGRAYFSMALVPGGSLEGLVRELTALGEIPPGPRANGVLDAHGFPPAAPGPGGPTAAFCRRIAAAAAGVAAALHALHAKGMFHRDVKPSNLLLGPGGRFLLADFGLVRRATGHLTEPGQVLGTPLYMSPEQWGDAATPADERSDVYGLGATLFEALAQRPPVTGRTLFEVMAQKQRAPAASLRRLSPAFPADLDAVVRRSLETDPSRRYASAAVLGRDLESFAQDRPVTARPLGPVTRGGRWVARRWKPLAVAALLLVAAGAWWLLRPAEVTIRSLPVGQVTVDGRTLGPTPLEAVRLASGTHVVRITHARSHPLEFPIDVRPGERTEFARVLQPLDPNDVGYYKEVAAATGLDVASVTVRRTRRVMDDRPALLFPRGRYLQAPRAVVAWSTEAFDGLKVVITRAGAADGPLGEVLLASSEDLALVPMPADLRARIEPGASYRVALVLPEGEEVGTAEFSVLPTVESGPLGAKLDVRLAPLGSGHAMAPFLRAEGLLRDGLAGEAFESAVAGGGSWSPGAVGLRLQLLSLEAAGLKNVGPWLDLVDAYLGPDGG